MATKRDNVKKDDPLLTGVKRQTLPVKPAIPTTSKDYPSSAPHAQEPRRKKCFKYIYDKDTKKFCGRTCRSWFCIIAYSLIYLMFLITYTLIFLFTILMVFKHTDYPHTEKISLFTYSDRGIGLTATPTSEFSYPMLWYRIGSEEDYQKYISAIDRLLISRKNINDDSLGPCSKAPYGYGEKPCVIVRINRQFNWSGKPLTRNSTKSAYVPKEVKEWMISGDKLWLHCDGHHLYDKEHIGNITYFPHPPGFDPKLFPLDLRNSQSESPIIAVQFSGFEQGVSLVIQCNLWYENGPSSMEFMLYVVPQVLKNSTNIYTDFTN